MLGGPGPQSPSHDFLNKCAVRYTGGPRPLEFIAWWRVSHCCSVPHSCVLWEPGDARPWQDRQQRRRAVLQLRGLRVLGRLQDLRADHAPLHRQRDLDRHGPRLHAWVAAGLARPRSPQQLTLDWEKELILQRLYWLIPREKRIISHVYLIIWPLSKHF